MSYGRFSLRAPCKVQFVALKSGGGKQRSILVCHRRIGLVSADHIGRLAALRRRRFALAEALTIAPDRPAPNPVLFDRRRFRVLDVDATATVSINAIPLNQSAFGTPWLFLWLLLTRIESIQCNTMITV